MKAALFLRKTLGYRLENEFQIEFSDNTKADCISLVPPEKRASLPSIWTLNSVYSTEDSSNEPNIYHAPPEIFISDGPDGSVVGDWVKQNGAGVHHMAYEVEDVEKTMEEWRQKGYAEFCSDKPMSCPGLVQVFTKPSEITGIIYELISRQGEGFCKDNVKSLMESTK